MVKTPFYQCHINSNAKIVDFCEYALPINYGSQIKEHEFVRKDSGMFDVSHMQILDLIGENIEEFLRHLLSNDINKLNMTGKALYTTMLNENAGIIDDLIVYKLQDKYRIIANAGTREKDFSWIKNHAQNFKVHVVRCDNYAMLAVQGPEAINKVIQIRPKLAEKLLGLKPFYSFIDNDYFYARTGYTGENGLEILIPHDLAEEFWHELLAIGVMPCGLGARDTLRLEAGMNLYGHDMNEDINPIECGLDWVVDLTDSSRNFIGKEAYIKLKTINDTLIQTGLILNGKGILREGQKIYAKGNEIGVITSGTYSPTLQTSIAIARIKPSPTNEITVDIRGLHENVSLVKLPFVRQGKVLVNN